MDFLQSPTSPVDCLNEQVDKEQGEVEDVDPDDCAGVVQEPSRVESALFKARGEGGPIVIPGHKVRVDPHLSIDYVECEHLS